MAFIAEVFSPPSQRHPSPTLAEGICINHFHFLHLCFICRHEDQHHKTFTFWGKTKKDASLAPSQVSGRCQCWQTTGNHFHFPRLCFMCGTFTTFTLSVLSKKIHFVESKKMPLCLVTSVRPLPVPANYWHFHFLHLCFISTPLNFYFFFSKKDAKLLLGSQVSGLCQCRQTTGS